LVGGPSNVYDEKRIHQCGKQTMAHGKKRKFLREH
jgi:hypothetical protein